MLKMVHIQILALTLIIWTLITLPAHDYAEVRTYSVGGNSPSNIGGELLHSAEYMSFADMDGDGEEEFVGIETSSPDSLKSYASISRWENEDRVIEWQSDSSIFKRALLLGNLDDDALLELVIFGPASANSNRDTIQVVEWSDSTFQVAYSSDEFSGRLGALGDIDADGRQELILATLNVPKTQAEIDGTESVTLHVLRWMDDSFKLAFKFGIPYGVRSLTVGDIDSDGVVEVITHQFSKKINHSYIGLGDRHHGNIVVRSIDPTAGFQVRDSGSVQVPPDQTTRMPFLNYFGLFKCSDSHYLFLEIRERLWKSMLKYYINEDGELDTEDSNADDIEIFENGWRSTMAYSAERRAFVHIVDHSNIEFIPEQVFHTD